MSAIAVSRFLLSDLYRSQRAVVPIIIQAAILAILFGGDPGPLPAPWAASALALYPIAAWLGIVVANTEDPIQRHVTVVAAGGVGRVVGGILTLALAGDVLLSLISVVWPMVATHYPHPPSVVALGLGGHLVCAVTGTAVGLLCARPVVGKVGWSLLAAGTVVVVTGTQSHVPPVGTVVRALTSGGPPGSGAVVGTGLVIAAVLAVLAAGVSAAVALRSG
ncbi:MAG: hypothetical protein J0I34_27945 [Pseudonocardia sp.]|uniref:hypothetical protein n=1 Tax=unclassified Pseudonocardia TaxID=2619320 RepID=UPI0008699940|nr:MULTISPECIES: hypothetical protein [unclassified Pseudonocardia]MBN9112609.1 hypothetical protein [Pseudonocardia sp.]ODU24875.1 MAG: hypothetical protein ABS80_11130 [Pseudonocardia sp. SCN 72-51]ODV04715.1 MAG: hypothetical protein ABT15_19880 [Pseudonocardia sp. SCN 73-27]